jgi:predicted metal-dependent enzyme (double-stranded beta helix superfamily)
MQSSFTKDKSMSHTLEGFAAACHDLLKTTPGPKGREQVRDLVREVLQDREFVEKTITADMPERKVIYQDPELGFCILAHVYHNAKTSPPHDHGPSWAIYGQAAGETHMSDYDLVEAPAPGKPGKARETRSYSLTPGSAHLYNEGDLHSPRRDGPTRLLRLEGLDMSTIKRDKFEAV